jgi:hypothetical protein
MIQEENILTHMALENMGIRTSISTILVGILQLKQLGGAQANVGLL